MFSQMSNIIVSIVYFSFRVFFIAIYFYLQKRFDLFVDRIVCSIRRKYDALRHHFPEFRTFA